MNSLAWKRLIGNGYSIVSRSKNVRKIILIYHAVGNSPWAISENVFKQQMQWLSRNAKIVSLSELLINQSKNTEVEVAITFDDGYSCLHDVVFPILKEENATATVYINTGWIGDTDQMRKNSRADLGHYPNEKFLTWDEVKTLEEHGWEIGSHGVNHIDLTQQTSEILFRELINSKKEIEHNLQKKCLHFAYTWANHSSKVRKAVLSAGYQYAVAGIHASIKNQNCMALPRLNVDKDYSLQDFKNIIDGKWDFIGIIQTLKRFL